MVSRSLKAWEQPALQPSNRFPAISRPRGRRRSRRLSSVLLGSLSVAALLLTGCTRKHLPTYPSNLREYAYVTNGGSNTVTVINVKYLRVDRTIQVGRHPDGVAASPSRNEVYVVNTGSRGNNGSISVINAETNNVVATIPVQRQPHFIDVDPTGQRAYVANSGSNSVSVIDLAKRRQIAVIGVGENPQRAILSPNGNSLIVTNQKSGSVSIINPHTYQVRSVWTGCPQASDAVILPDSSKAFIACSGSRHVMVIGLAQHPDKDHPNRSTLPDRELALLDVGTTPVHLALKPDGGEIFVSNFGSDTISEINTSTNEVGGAYLVGAEPSYGIVASDDSTLWVSNFNANTIGVYSIDYGKLINTVHVGDGPNALAFSSDGFWLFAADQNSGDVSVVRTLSYTQHGVPVAGRLFTLLPAGSHPNAIVVKAFAVK
ncbi:MAG: YncE family protein [Acidobacteriaceae bacterium]